MIAFGSTIAAQIVAARWYSTLWDRVLEPVAAKLGLTETQIRGAENGGANAAKSYV